jgi:arylsulfatase A-like enzyme
MVWSALASALMSLQLLKMNPHPALISLSLCIGASALSSCSEDKESKSHLPNVVFIYIDDLGWKDLACMGSMYYETPNLDRLATQSLLFTNAYAGAMNCAPSRACLLTGTNTPRHRIYTVNDPNRGDPRTRQLIAPPIADSINPTDFTLAHLFKNAGYHSCAIGKWHLSSNPVNNGFDINIGGDRRGNPGPDGYFAPYNISNISQGPDGEYLTDRLTDEAITYIESNKDARFFLFMSYYTVHTPLQGKEQIIKKYREKGGSNGQENQVYAAMVESMDENIGRILSKLDETNLAENTIVVFTSDNGGLRAISHQDPLRAGKGSYYEGGIRVPLIIRWPGKINIGVSDEPVVNLDFFPTFKSVLGVPLENLILDGRDLSPLFTGETFEKRPIFWHFPIYAPPFDAEDDQGRDPLFRTRPGSAMRFGKWKLHEYFEDGALELFDLEQDPGEVNNLLSSYPDKASELFQMLDGWRKETNAIVPDERNPLYDPEFEREEINKFRN